jgi:hypothetical protein
LILNDILAAKIASSYEHDSFFLHDIDFWLTLVEITSIALRMIADIYGESSDLDPHTERLLKKLRDAVGREIGVQKQLCSVVGALDLLFQAATPLPPPLTSQVFGEAVVEPIVFSKKARDFGVFNETS